jgi:hypothetical protein
MWWCVVLSLTATETELSSGRRVGRAESGAVEAELGTRSTEWGGHMKGSGEVKTTRHVAIEMEASEAKWHATNIGLALSIIEQHGGDGSAAARATLEAILSGIGMGLGQLPREPQ